MPANSRSGWIAHSAAGQEYPKAGHACVAVSLRVAAMKVGLLGILLSGCVAHTHPECQSQCALPKPREYCYDIPKGYVLPQDKYDPSFVPCRPLTVPPDPPEQDDDAEDGDDDVDDEDQGSSSGGGGGANAYQGDEESDASAGHGAGAHHGGGTPSTAQSSVTGGGAGATATSGSVTSEANAGSLL